MKTRLVSVIFSVVTILFKGWVARGDPLYALSGQGVRLHSE